jgi:hypothetical protein
MYNNLRFFNGLTTDLNLVKNSQGIWAGRIYMPEVSVQLYETVNLFVLEECKYLGDLTPNTPVAESVDPTQFVFKWKQGNLADSEDIILYSAKLDDGMYKIENLTEVRHDLIDSSVSPGFDTNGVREVNTKQNVALQVNVALSSKIEGPHTRTLEVYESVNGTETLIASIQFYGEVEAEDERLKTLLQNFGATLDEGDFLLFKDHDISEMSPDYVLLNQKRKELLLELHNIKPFVGTYKAILNAIDFFGYDRITLKEYWINVDKSSNSFGKLYAVPVPNASKRGEMIRKKMRFKVPSNTTKKTSRFSLVYRLNEPNGTFDYWDIPNVDEVFDYTPDEVIIKLYGLKNKLQREYLPLNAKIIDITGEGDYFAQKNLNVWNIQNGIGFFSEGHDIKFEMHPKERPIFIEDTSMVLKSMLDQNDPTSNYDLFLNMIPGTEDQLTEAQRIELKSIYKEFYETYYNRELHSYNQNIPVGAPVTLDGTLTFDDIWDEADFTWEDAMDANSNLKVTWENWWKRWVYEVEWVVTNHERGYNQSFRGPIDDFLVLPLNLPYSGKYSVEFRTYDLFGHRSHYRKDDFVDVRLKELELYGIYKWKEDTTWNDKVLDWRESGGYWDFAQDNLTKIDDSIATLYLTLDRANYVHMEDDQGVRFSTVRRYFDIYSEDGFSETTGPYQWDECDFRWNDTKHLWWKAMRVGSDLTASFKIDHIEQGDQLVIEHTNPITREITTATHTITSPSPVSYSDIGGWNAVINELNDSTDPIISKFNYNVVFEDIDGTNPLASDIFRFILAVGWEYSYTYDYSNVYIVKANPSSNSAVSGETHVVHYNPTWDDTRVFKSFAEVERSTHVTISTDISKFPGAKNAIWRIQNITNPEITDIYYNNMWLTYIFKYPGYYSIELEAEDTYGNKNVVKRNMLKVK